MIERHHLLFFGLGRQRGAYQRAGAEEIAALRGDTVPVASEAVVAEPELPCDDGDFVAVAQEFFDPTQVDLATAALGADQAPWPLSVGRS